MNNDRLQNTPPILGHMKANVHWGPLSKWHHRILGSLWLLCGLVQIAIVVGHGGWTEYQFWMALLVATACVVAAIGFILGRRWARWAMGVLMVLAVLFFLDMMMMFGFGGNRQGVLYMLIAAGIAAYTLLFLVISATWHSQNSAK
jgi:hypothetical protein